MRKHWLFIVAVAIQVSIVILVPARRAFSRAFGETVLIQVEPYDPYDILSGYYVQLRLGMSDLSGLPAGTSFKAEDGDDIYVLLARDDDNIARPQDVVNTLSQAASQPQLIPLKGTWSRGRFDIGIDRFYVPEGKGTEIEDALRTHGDKAYAELKIDAAGVAALVRLHVADVIYED